MLEKFDVCIRTLNKKLASGCFAVRVIGKGFESLMARDVNFSLIDTNLSYGIVFWETVSLSD